MVETKQTTLDKAKVKDLSKWMESIEMPEPQREVFDALVAQFERLEEVLRGNAKLLKLLREAFSGQGKSESLARKKNRGQKKSDTPESKPPGPQGKKVEKRSRREPTQKDADASSPPVPTSTEAMFRSDLASGAAPQGIDVDADGRRIASEDEVKNLKSEWNEREFVDVKIVVTRTKRRVQTLTNTRTGQQVTGEVPDVPPGSKYTYDTYFLLVMMHVQMCTPYTRLAVATGIPKTACYDMVRFVAATLLPVYVHLWRLLATRTYLMTDDTTTKILEKTPTDRRSDKGEEEEGGSSSEHKALAPTSSLMAAISKGLGLPSVGTTVEGKKASVTVIHGCDAERDFDSRIVFYLSHRGQAGDLLDLLLKDRSGGPPVKLMSDMLSANFPEPETRQRVGLVSAACGAHARRRFFQNTDLDDDMWYFVRGFAIIADIEDYASENASKPGEVVRIRQTYGGRVWTLMKSRAEKFMFESGWEPSSAPFKACAYLVKHFTALTRYLEDENLHWTNNLCERALRREKIMLGSSRFRETFEGHAALDIITSLLATGTRVGGDDFDARAYFVETMKHRNAVALNPETWTPAAWMKRIKLATANAT